MCKNENIKEKDVIRFKLKSGSFTEQEGELYVLAISPDCYLGIDVNGKDRRFKKDAHEYSRTGERYDSAESFLKSRREHMNDISLSALLEYANKTQPYSISKKSRTESRDVALAISKTDPKKNKYAQVVLTLYKSPSDVFSENAVFRPVYVSQLDRLYFIPSEKGSTLTRRSGKYLGLSFTDRTKDHEVIKTIKEADKEAKYKVYRNWKNDSINGCYYITIKED